MKAQVNTKALSVVSAKQRMQDYMDLLKPGITTLVMITALAGFYLGSAGQLDVLLLIHTVIGTGLVAGGGGAFNHWLERDADAKMQRTKSRPLPSGRLSVFQVVLYGSIVSVAGIIYLAIAVNGITAFLAAVSWVSYVLIYTPLKRVTPLATLVGAIPGALPPMGGWTAAHGSITFEAWVLFTILFMWQLPHFLAIAWLCKDDYARGGFPMLTVLRNSEHLTGRQMMLYAAGLLVVSLVPTFIGLSGMLYFAGAFAMGLAFLGINILMARSTTILNAKRALWASIIYLPVLLILMMVDKIIL